MMVIAWILVGIAAVLVSLLVVLIVLVIRTGKKIAETAHHVQETAAETRRNWGDMKSMVQLGKNITGAVEVMRAHAHSKRRAASDSKKDNAGK